MRSSSLYTLISAFGGRARMVVYNVYQLFTLFVLDTNILGGSTTQWRNVAPAPKLRIKGIWLQKFTIRRPIQRPVDAKKIFGGKKAPGAPKSL